MGYYFFQAYIENIPKSKTVCHSVVYHESPEEKNVTFMNNFDALDHDWTLIQCLKCPYFRVNNVDDL